MISWKSFWGVLRNICAELRHNSCFRKPHEVMGQRSSSGYEKGPHGAQLLGSRHCTLCLWPRLPEGAVSGILDRTPVLCLSLQSGSLCAAAEAVSALNCSRYWTQRTQLHVWLLPLRSMNLKLMLFHVILHTRAGRDDTCAGTFLQLWLLPCSSIPCRQG